MNRIFFVIISLALLVSVRAEEVYCRFISDLGSAYGELVDDMIHVLDRAPWDGGATTGIMMRVTRW